MRAGISNLPVKRNRDPMIAVRCNSHSLRCCLSPGRFYNSLLKFVSLINRSTPLRAVWALVFGFSCFFLRMIFKEFKPEDVTCYQDNEENPMERRVIQIDEEKCTGCGGCIHDCPEGAIRIIKGKARLVSDLFCDGLGACIGHCPEGAICVVERDAAPYDEKTVMETIAPQGESVIRAHLDHLAGHRQGEYYRQAIEFLNDHAIVVPRHGGLECHEGTEEPGHNPYKTCPGIVAQSIPRETQAESSGSPEGKTVSELRQWPVQLALLNPEATYFENADLLISADCIPFAYADFHREFLRKKIVVMFCPKLDADIDSYIEKLAEIFTRHKIRSLTLLRMEVPCCNGVGFVVERALEKAGRIIPVFEKTVTIRGQVI